MQDATKGASAPQLLTLAPGEQLTGLTVFQIDQPHQRTLLQLATATARQRNAQIGLQGSAIFRARGTGDVAVLTQWASQDTYAQTAPTLLKPPASDLYQVVWHDRISGPPAARLALEEGLFHFINVFRLTPRKRPEFIQYFQQLTRLVRGHSGYISATLLVSLDGYHAVNVGQFQTQAEFQAMLRKPRVVLGFAQGVLRRIVPGPPRLRQYDLVQVVVADRASREHAG